jgi:hypothetical protein
MRSKRHYDRETLQTNGTPYVRGQQMGKAGYFGTFTSDGPGMG